MAGKGENCGFLKKDDLMAVIQNHVREWFSKGAVPVPAASAPPGKSLQMQILRPYLDLLNQKLWGWAPGVCVFISTPGDSDTQSVLRTSV